MFNKSKRMKISRLMFFSIFIFSSCDIANNNPDCSAVLCDYVAKSVRLRYVDKSSSAPLFSAGSGYKLSDLKVTITTNSNYSPVLTSDPNDPSIIILTPLIGGETLTLGNLPADKISIETRSLGKECCAGYEISSLKINGETICAPCRELNKMVATIKK